MNTHPAGCDQPSDSRGTVTLHNLLGVLCRYVRMYWAKKILEWSATPEEAIEVAIYLNDKWSLDGRDPSGCAAWGMGKAQMDRAVDLRRIGLLNGTGQ